MLIIVRSDRDADKKLSVMKDFIMKKKVQIFPRIISLSLLAAIFAFFPGRYVPAAVIFAPDVD